MLYSCNSPGYPVNLLLGFQRFDLASYGPAIVLLLLGKLGAASVLLLVRQLWVF